MLRVYSTMQADPSQSVADLVDVVQRLSLARDLPTVQDIVRRSARRLTGADGATFVLRDGAQCFYADEDAIEPLWKGQRFPMSACISGWAMLNRQAVVIEDIYADARIPHDAYRPTFVKSLVMTPIRTLDPIGAIGVYWATRRTPSPDEVGLLRALADTTAVAMENVRVFTELEERVKARTAELETANHQLETVNRDLLTAQQQADRVFTAFARALPGTVLDGKYRLDKQIGAGGFGVVFRGWHLALACPVAIKVFRPSPGNDSAIALTRFLREGAAAAQMQHEGAVRVLDSGVSSEGVAFLIMELLRGGSLAQEIAAAGVLPLRHCVEIARRVASVLAAAHRRGILHRDIKPDNIILHQAEDGREIVKVVDFGIAKFFDMERNVTINGLTRAGEHFCTPAFTAPERLTGAPDDGRSDVFSLGAVLYQMMCGDTLNSRRQLRQFGIDAVPGQATPLHFSRRGSAELEALIERTLAYDPARRPTAQQLADELARLSLSLDDAVALPSATEAECGNEAITVRL